MSTSIINLQVWTNSKMQGQFREKMVDALSRYANVNNLIQVGVQEKSDWNIALAYAKNTSWIGLYEEGSRIDSENLEQLALWISKELETNAIVTQIYDGKVLILQLFSNGDRLDYYNSCPECLVEGISEEQVAEIQSDSICWEKMLVKGYTVDDLTRVWEEDTTVAEATLAALAKCLDMNGEQSVMGYDDLQESEECEVDYYRYKK